MIRTLPPLKYLRECFLYEESSGLLFWRKRPLYHFTTAAIWQVWNKRFSGRVAFSLNKRGYVAGNLDGKYCAAHRVVWKLKTKQEPPVLIDHWDRNKSNNRWRNLRAATKPQNCINRGASSKNTTGHPGVHKHKNKNKWVAQIGLAGGKRYVGIFDSPEEASQARKRAAKEVYGEFAS